MAWCDTLNLPISAQGEWSAKRFFGDPQRAAAYLPVAYALLGQVKQRMAQGGVTYGHQTLRLPDGTLIRVIRNHQQNLLEITTRPTKGGEALWTVALFMESGFLEVRPLYPRGTPKDPAIVHVPEPVKAEAQSGRSPRWLDVIRLAGTQVSQNTDEVRAYPTGMASLAINESLEEDDPEDYVDGRPVRPPTSDKRYAILNSLFGLHPASVSGKMKLWAQACMGLNYTNEELIELFRLPQSAGASFGLLTTTHYDYFLVRIAGGVRITPFLHAAGGRALKKILVANEYKTTGNQSHPIDRAMRQKIEAYLLSTIIGLDEARAYTLDTPEFEIIGEALAYGWKFNWDGHRASIVTNECIIEDYRYRHNVQRLYTLTLSDREVPQPNGSLRWQPAQAVLHLAEQAICTPRQNIDITWAPDLLRVPLLHYHYWVPCGGQNTPLVECNGVPIYCWYGLKNPKENPLDYYPEEDEKLLLVRFSLAIRPLPSLQDEPGFIGPTQAKGQWYSQPGYTPITQGGFYLVAAGDSNADLDLMPKQGEDAEISTYDHDLTVGSVTEHCTNVGEFANSVVYQVNRPTGGDPPNTQCTTPPPEAPYPLDYADNVLLRKYHATGYSAYSRNNRAHTGETAFIIPWNSSESVYFVSKYGERNLFVGHTMTIDDDLASQINFNALIVEWPNQGLREEFPVNHLSVQYYLPYTMESYGGEGWELTIVQTLFGKTFTEELLRKTVQKGTLIDYHNAELGKKPTITIVGDAEEYNDLVYSYDALFDPTICGVNAYPYLGSFYALQESALGVAVFAGHEVENNDPHVTDPNLPEDGARFNSLFVGWI